MNIKLNVKTGSQYLVVAYYISRVRDVIVLQFKSSPNTSKITKKNLREQFERIKLGLIFVMNKDS